MKATRQEVYAAIESEREYQQKRWNPSTTTSGGEHSFTEWLAYMEDYIDEAQHILARNPEQVATPQVAHIMRKIVTMGVAAMEQLGAPLR